MIDEQVLFFGVFVLLSPPFSSGTNEQNNQITM